MGELQIWNQEPLRKLCCRIYGRNLPYSKPFPQNPGEKVKILSLKSEGKSSKSDDCSLKNRLLRCCNCKDCKDVRPPCFQRTRTGARSHLVSCRCIKICQTRAPLRVGRWRWRHDGAAHGDIYTAKAVIRIVINHGDVRIRSSAYGGS